MTSFAPVRVQFDPVTGLPNQDFFASRLQETLAGEEKTGAVLLIDLDSFRTIKDTYGYLVGNELLKLTADTLRRVVRDTDTVGHLGGDEFAVLAPGFSEVGEIYALVNGILGAFNMTWKALGHEFFMTASVGVSVFPEEDTTVLDLLRNGAAALARAKDQGKNQYQFYQAGWNEKLLERHKLEVELRHAVDRGELELRYQPQVEGFTGTILGFEALLRWNHPTRGLLTPGSFLDMAEETGLWLPLGQWVLEEACRQNQAWREEGLPPVPVAVNVSANQVQQKGFLKLVREVLDKTGMNPGGLELEITEGAVVKAMRSSVHTLQLIRNMGVKIALDDFGTGYSSLSYLKDLPVDVLKVDRSFVSEIGKSRNADAVISAILVLAQSLGLRVIAEGVETTDQRDFLLARGNPTIQGYLFAKALTAAEAGRALGRSTLDPIPDRAEGYHI